MTLLQHSLQPSRRTGLWLKATSCVSTAGDSRVRSRFTSPLTSKWDLYRTFSFLSSFPPQSVLLSQSKLYGPIEAGSEEKKNLPRNAHKLYLSGFHPHLLAQSIVLLQNKKQILMANCLDTVFSENSKSQTCQVALISRMDPHTTGVSADNLALGLIKKM